MSDLRMAKAVSLTGSKIEYIPNKYASTTSAILVLDYDIVAKQNMVKSLGKPVQYRDVVRLLEEYPSAHVTACPADDALLVEYTSETANRKCRKADSHRTLLTFEDLAPTADVRASPCLGFCGRGPSVALRPSSGGGSEQLLQHH